MPVAFQYVPVLHERLKSGVQDTGDVESDPNVGTYNAFLSKGIVSNCGEEK